MMTRKMEVATMPLKTVTVEGITYATVQDGKPVYTLADGSEVGYNGEELAIHVNKLNQENGGRRLAEKEATEKLKAFEGIDAEAARKALSTVANLDGKTMVDAEQAEQSKQAAIQAVVGERDAAKQETEKLKGAFANTMIGAQFAQSKFVQDKLIVPASMVAATFSRHFSVEDMDTAPRLVAKGADGNPIYSRSTPGAVADFDEALETLVNAYPHRDEITKGAGKPGSGAPGSGGGGPNGSAQTVTQKEAQAMILSDPAGFHKQLEDKQVVIADN